jgi:hypothetical protein
MGEIQNGMGGGMIWGTPGDEDGEGEYEHFSINDGVSSDSCVLLEQS